MDLAWELGELGNTSEAVAANLKRLGIRGWRGSPYGCPVALFCRKIGYEDPLAYPDAVSACIDGERVEIRTGSAIETFIGLFDSGAWPELEEKE